jgi:hypothetical protein
MDVGNGSVGWDKGRRDCVQGARGIHRFLNQEETVVRRIGTRDPMHPQMGWEAVEQKKICR